MLERARDRAPEVRDRLVLARAEELPFEGETFDVVVAVGALEYTDMNLSLPELARVLRPGGRAVLGLRNGRAPVSAWQTLVTHPLARAMKSRAKVGRKPPKLRRPALSNERAGKVLSESGLEIQERATVACEVIPDPLDALAPRLAYCAAGAAERSAALRRVFGTQHVVLAAKAAKAPNV